jgi:hypothetical protein
MGGKEPPPRIDDPDEIRNLIRGVQSFDLTGSPGPEAVAG